MGFAQLHTSIGTGAGVRYTPEGREIPVVMMYLPKNDEALQRLEAGEAFMPEEDAENWQTIALSIMGARHLVHDLKESIESAIQGPPEDGDTEGEEWKQGEPQE